MKHFEPIVIQEETEERYELLIKPYADEPNIIVLCYCEQGVQVRGISFRHTAATRLRDALNTILND